MKTTRAATIATSSAPMNRTTEVILLAELRRSHAARRQEVQPDVVDRSWHAGFYAGALSASPAHPVRARRRAEGDAALPRPCRGLGIRRDHRALDAPLGGQDGAVEHVGATRPRRPRATRARRRVILPGSRSRNGLIRSVVAIL